MEKASLSMEKIDLAYDEEADVLYLSFGEPREADESIEVEDGIVYRLKGGEVLGITVVAFKARAGGLKTPP